MHEVSDLLCLISLLSRTVMGQQFYCNTVTSLYSPHKQRKVTGYERGVGQTERDRRVENVDTTR
jgi:hypothetical protein